MKTANLLLITSACAVLAMLIAGQAAAETPSISSLIFEAPSVVGLGDEDDAADTPLATEATPPTSPWTSSIGAGLSYSQTDDITVGANLNGSFARNDENSKWETSLKYIYNFDDNEVKDNFGVIQTNYERLLGDHPNWLWLAQASFQYHETEAYKTRTKAFGGLGYLVSRTDSLKLLLKGGLGVSKDRNGNSDVIPRTLFGYSADWRINDLVRLTSDASIENDIGAYSEYLVVLEVKLTITVSKLNNLGLDLTLRDEYDSTPSPGDSWNQVWLTMGLNDSF
ncbi:MAG: DUF481 domain-containing protein [Planctomycetota bacterium]|jgi:hypothetical protein|nr:DUF481 domain-containing protein [Planctomycetota bacterium]MDA1025080.1 DUF481 domain-containing protein [Planctomycetota bacterium]